MANTTVNSDYNDIYSNAEIINKDSFARLKYKNKQREARRSIFYVLTSLLICALFLAACVFLFFKVKSVTVEGNSFYDSAAITDACGIAHNVNLYSVKQSDVLNSLSASLPYIKSVKIKRIIPSTIVLVIEEDSPTYYTELLGEYFVLSDELRVIAHTDSEAKANTYGDKLKKIALPEVSNAVVGKKIGFVKEINYNYITDFLGNLSKESIFSKTGYIDISDKFHIYIIADEGKYKISLGDSSDIPLKISFVETVIKSSLKESDCASINVEYVDSLIVSLANAPFEY